MPQTKEKKKARYDQAEACFAAFTFARDNELPELAALFRALPKTLQEALDHAFPA
jgi:hypothetical protein